MSHRALAVRSTQVALVVGLFGLYEVCMRTGLLDRLTFIPLSTIVKTTATDLGSSAYWSETLLPTGLEILMAFGGAALLGVAGGIVLWWSDAVYHMLQPYLLLLYAVPIFALFPIVVSLVGIGPAAVVITSTAAAVPAVLIQTAIGFRGTRPVLIKVGRSLCRTRRQVIRHVYFPAAWPHIFTGLRFAFAYSILSVISTEFVLSTRGLGHAIAYAYDSFDLPQMYASITLVMLIGLAATGALVYAETHIQRRAASD